MSEPTFSSTPVKHWEGYDQAGDFTHEFEIENNLTAAGLLEVTIGAVEGMLDDSMTMKIGVGSGITAESVPEVHVFIGGSDSPLFTITQEGGRIFVKTLAAKVLQHAHDPDSANFHDVFEFTAHSG